MVAERYDLVVQQVMEFADGPHDQLPLFVRSNRDRIEEWNHRAKRLPEERERELALLRATGFEVRPHGLVLSLVGAGAQALFVGRRIERQLLSRV